MDDPWNFLPSPKTILPTRSQPSQVLTAVHPFVTAQHTTMSEPPNSPMADTTQAGSDEQPDITTTGTNLTNAGSDATSTDNNPVAHSHAATAINEGLAEPVSNEDVESSLNNEEAIGEVAVTTQSSSEEPSHVIVTDEANVASTGQASVPGSVPTSQALTPGSASTSQSHPGTAWSTNFVPFPLPGTIGQATAPMVSAFNSSAHLSHPGGVSVGHHQVPPEAHLAGTSGPGHMYRRPTFPTRLNKIKQNDKTLHIEVDSRCGICTGSIEANDVVALRELQP